jgi:hypothetical protein
MRHDGGEARQGVQNYEDDLDDHECGEGAYHTMNDEALPFCFLVKRDDCTSN